MKKIKIDIPVSGICSTAKKCNKKDGWVDLGPTYVSGEGVMKHFWVKEHPSDKTERLKGTVEVPS